MFLLVNARACSFSTSRPLALGVEMPGWEAPGWCSVPGISPRGGLRSHTGEHGDSGCRVRKESREGGGRAVPSVGGGSGSGPRKDAGPEPLPPPSMSWVHLRQSCSPLPPGPRLECGAQETRPSARLAGLSRTEGEGGWQWGQTTGGQAPGGGMCEPTARCSSGSRPEGRGDAG